MNQSACALTRTTVVSAQGNWRWCAEDYLREIWWPQDRNLVRQFSGTVTCEMLHNLCILYGVARTIPGSGIPKYQPFADALNKHRDTAMTRDNTFFIVEQELSGLSQGYGKQPLSAISKAFWMKKQHPVVIYDSYAWQGLQRLGLSPGYDGYRTYYESWFRFFDTPETQEGLDDAESWLPDSPFSESLIKLGKADRLSLRDLAKSPLFTNRIVDRWLTYKGGITQFK